MVVTAATRGCCDMIKSRRFSVVLLIALGVGGSAHAFQESAPAPQPNLQLPAEPSETDLGLAPSDDGQTGGSLVPNLDFGLELLYGNKSSAPADGGTADDDSTFKGRLKHTF